MWRSSCDSSIWSWAPAEEALELYLTPAGRLDRSDNLILSPYSFHAYSDADHGANLDNGRSTSAYVVKIGSGAVSWSSCLQSIVVLLTTEAEFNIVVAGPIVICYVPTADMAADLLTKGLACLKVAAALPQLGLTAP
jgi:hypothetical protein